MATTATQPRAKALRLDHATRNLWRRERKDGVPLVSRHQSKRMLRGTTPHDPNPQRWSLFRGRVMPMKGAQLDRYEAALRESTAQGGLFDNREDDDGR